MSRKTIHTFNKLKYILIIFGSGNGSPMAMNDDVVGVVVGVFVVIGF